MIVVNFFLTFNFIYVKKIKYDLSMEVKIK